MPFLASGPSARPRWWSPPFRFATSWRTNATQSSGNASTCCRGEGRSCSSPMRGVPPSSVNAWRSSANGSGSRYSTFHLPACGGSDGCMTGQAGVAQKPTRREMGSGVPGAPTRRLDSYRGSGGPGFVPGCDADDVAVGVADVELQHSVPGPLRTLHDSSWFTLWRTASGDYGRHGREPRRTSDNPRRGGARASGQGFRGKIAENPSRHHGTGTACLPEPCHLLARNSGRRHRRRLKTGTMGWYS